VNGLLPCDHVRGGGDKEPVLIAVKFPFPVGDGHVTIWCVTVIEDALVGEEVSASERIEVEKEEQASSRKAEEGDPHREEGMMSPESEEERNDHSEEENAVERRKGGTAKNKNDTDRCTTEETPQ